MIEEEMVTDETLEVEEQEVETEATTSEEDEVEESVDDLRARIAKLEEEKENQKKRAEKAEAKAKGSKPVATAGLSAQDLLALSKANIDTDDLDEVLDFASYRKQPIHEVLKSSTLKAILAEKAELRKSASAVNTGPTRRGSAGISDERLLSDADNGILPESDADMKRLAKLRLHRK